MFSRFFRPRWQHTDPAVRLRALATLDPEQDRDTLALLARGDASPEVRRAAVARLRDPALLEAHARDDSDGTVRDAALQRLQVLLCQPQEAALSLENRLRLVGLTRLPDLLVAVARHAGDAELRLAALARIEDPAALLSLAIDGSDTHLRQNAAAQLHEEEALRTLARDGRDKHVVRMARDRLKQRQQQQQEATQQQQRRQEWLEQVRAHSQRPVDNLYLARLQQLRQRGQSLFSDASEPEKDQAAQLLDQCQAKLDQLEAEQQQRAAARAAAAEQAQAVSTLKDTLAALSQHDDWPSANSLTAMLASQQRRWQEANAICAATAELSQQFQTLVARWQLLVEHWQAWQPDAPATSWPADLPIPPPLRQPTATQPTHVVTPEPEPAQHDLERTLAVLGNALRRRQLRLANRLWHKLENASAQLSPGQQARMERLASDLAELRDWHAFAAEPKKLQLCEEMEALVNEEMPAREKADTIQLLHDRWRELMSADQEADQALWDRFRAASDAAWAPCREHFAELDRERSLNLSRRQQLCDQLAHYLDTLDPATVTDWAPVAEIRRTAPQEWKQYQPVRFTDARETSRQFSALLKRLDTLLDDVASRHTALMEALISEAEQLATSDDPREAAERCKQLQSRWQQVGWAPVSSRRKLYKRFRQHADTIFARLQASRDAMRQQYQQQSEALRQAMQQLQRALDTDPDEQSLQALTTLANEMADMPCPRREEKLLQQRDQLLRQARERRQRWPQWQRWATIRQRLAQLPDGEETLMQQKLAVAMEVATGIESPPAARELRMQWQLQHLGDAMKSQSLSPLQRCTTLLDNSPWLAEGVSADIRARLLTAWKTQEPER